MVERVKLHYITFKNLIKRGRFMNKEKVCGVNYVFHASGNAGGMTPLLDREEKSVISSIINR